MSEPVLVHVDLEGEPIPVGRLWTHFRRGRQSATFEYDRSWLEDPRRFALDPALTLGPGPFHTPDGRTMFGALGDSAPDRWGRLLMRRAARRRAGAGGETPRSPREIDYLLEVDDEARQGALRFSREAGGPFLAQPGRGRIPPLVALPQLLAAADHVASDTDSEEELRLLLAPGSSLGGSRPKASVHDRNNRLAIAKFPHRDDEIDTVTWEAVALNLAEKAGVSVPARRVERVGNRPVLVLQRFDRTGGIRIPFLSAMSMIGAADGEVRSYLELADAIRRHGARPAADLRELWRRIVFTILISNVDDHLRNHGFLYTGTEGWGLSPAYDLNPTPADIRPRILSTAIDIDSQAASLEHALSVAEYFDMAPAEARHIAGTVGGAVAEWRTEAAACGLSRQEIDRMASAFEHEDLETAETCT